MYFSMHELRHVCSLFDSEEPGEGTHLSKQFSFTLEMRYLALMMLVCITTAFWRRERIWVEEALAGEGEREADVSPKGEGAGGRVVSGGVWEDGSLLPLLSLSEPELPPKRPPNAMVVCVRGDLGIGGVRLRIEEDFIEGLVWEVEMPDWV